MGYYLMLGHKYTVKFQNINPGLIFGIDFTFQEWGGGGDYIQGGTYIRNITVCYINDLGPVV